MAKDFTFGSKVWPGLIKVGEETAELNVVLCKLQMNGGDPKYWGGRDLGPELIAELGDVMAAIAFFCDHNDVDPKDVMLRAAEKYALYEQWHEDNQ